MLIVFEIFLKNFQYLLGNQEIFSSSYYCLISMNFINNQSDYHLEQNNRALNGNEIQAYLLGRKIPFSSIGPLRFVCSEQHGAILHNMARRLVDKKITLSNIYLTSGLGLPKDCSNLPVRLPALLLPGLEILRGIKKRLNEAPYYLIYQATDFIIKTNKLDYARAQEYAQQMENYIKNFIFDLYPDIADHVLCFFHQEQPAGLINTILSEAGRIRSLIEQNLLSDVFNRSESRHSNSGDQYHVYAAANVVYNGGVATEYPFSSNLPTSPELLMPIGGEGEKPFFKLLSQAADTSSSHPIIPLLTSLGSRPTYYSYPSQGDLFCHADFKKAYQDGLQVIKDGPIRNDIGALISCGLTPERLSDIYPANM